MEPESRRPGDDESVGEKAHEEVELVREGEAEHTPLALIGGLTVGLAVVVGVVILAGLLLWWLA